MIARSGASSAGRAVAVMIAVAAAIAPLMVTEYWLTFATSVGIFALAALGLLVVVGLGGMFDLGHAAYFGVAAYVTVIWARDGHGPVLVGAALGIVLATAAGAVVALLVVRLAGFPLALGTLAVGLFAQSIAGGLPATGKNLGTTGPTRRLVTGLVITPEGVYALVVGLLVVATWAVWWWGRSGGGRTMALVRASPTAAAAAGISPATVRVRVFVVGAAISGVAGACWAVSVRFVDPGAIGLARSVDFITIVIIGGIASPLGPTLGALFVRGLPEIAGPLADYETMFIGLAFIVVLRFVPGGIAALPARLLRPSADPGPGGRARSDGTVSGRVARPDRSVTDHGRAALVTEHAPEDGALLACSDISVSFGGLVALDGVSFEVRHGEVHGLVGANGSGKSTMLDVVSGLRAPERGRVRWQGDSVDGWSPHRRARVGMARTFQLGGLADDLTIRENVMVGARRSGGRAGAKRADEILDWLGLASEADRRPNEVSAAVARLAEVGRCLMADPLLMVLDEPAAGLDRDETARLAEVLLAVRARGVAVLLVEHDTELVAACCQVVTRLDAGSVVSSGPAATPVASP